jgi:hypothetical protein
LVGEVGAECGCYGIGEEEGRDVGEHGACVSLGSFEAAQCVVGEVLLVMMDSVGQWTYVVEMVRMCVLAMWPMYPEVFVIL